MAPTCNHSTKEVKGSGSQIQGHFASRQMEGTKMTDEQRQKKVTYTQGSTLKV